MEQVEGRPRFTALPWRGAVFLAIGLLLVGWLLNTPPGLLGKADAIGYAVCHRISARSFHLGDRALPLCARCSGMYLGALAGLVYQTLTARRKGGLPAKRIWPLLAMLLLAFAVDGLNSYLHLFPGAPTLYEPENWLRTLTGSGMGILVAAVLFPAYNQTVWADWQDEPALPGLQPLIAILLLVVGVDLLLFSGSPWILYPLALLSAAGVIILLTLVYTVTALILLRKENRFVHPTQLILPLVGGFGFGLLQIALLDLARFLLTGSWDGFHLG